MDVGVYAKEGTDGEPASAVIDFTPGDFPTNDPFDEARLRELLVEFQGFAKA